MNQCSKDSCWPGTTCETSVTSFNASSTSSTLSKLRATHSGNSKVATFSVPSTGSCAKEAYPGKFNPAMAKPCSLAQSKYMGRSAITTPTPITAFGSLLPLAPYA